jgi:branched-chain amino acid transport system ATP-binding protein
MPGLLQLHDVSLSFQGVRAINALSFSVAAGEICALIGPNGAGKSSLLNVINGVYRADSGDVVFDGTRFEKIHPQKAARLGIGRTFQHNALFRRLSVKENVLAGLSREGRATFAENIFRFGRDGGERRSFQARADRIIDFLGLGRYADSVVSTLPYGVQKRVDLARALVADPKLLLLDEPMAGMNQDEQGDLRGQQFVRHHGRPHRTRCRHRAEPRASCRGARLRTQGRRRRSGGGSKQP